MNIDLHSFACNHACTSHAAAVNSFDNTFCHLGLSHRRATSIAWRCCWHIARVHMLSAMACLLFGLQCCQFRILVLSIDFHHIGSTGNDSTDCLVGAAFNVELKTTWRIVCFACATLFDDSGFE